MMDGSRWAIIGVAIVWASVIFASSVILKGSSYWGQMIPILGGGAAASIIILGGAQRKKKQKDRVP